MSEFITLIIVIGASALAVALLVALNAFMGGWTRARFSGLEEAGQRITRDVMDFDPSTKGFLDSDRLSALVMDKAQDRVGLAVCLGDGVAVRALRHGELKSLESAGLELVVRLDDYTLPKVTVRAQSTEELDFWKAALSDFVAAPTTETRDAKPA